MKRLLISVAGSAFLLPAAANSADLSTAPVVTMVDYSAHDWSGFYAGVHAGYGGNRFDYAFDYTDNGEIPPFSLGGKIGLTSSGPFAGGQAGYNWQNGNFVFGIEADIAAAAIEGKLSLTSDLGPGEVSGYSRVNWFGTGRVRLGLTPADGVLVYATGGVAVGGVESGLNLSALAPGVGTSTSSTEVGWTVGAGVEYAITRNISLKTEYQFVSLGRQNLISLTDGDESFTLDAIAKFHTLRAGLNFNFGAGGGSPGPLPPAPTTFDWSGFYAGINGGFGGDQFDYPLSTFGVTILEPHITSSGLFFGGQGGYNWQTGNWVFGLEADIQAADIEGKLSLSIDGVPGEISGYSKVDWFGTGRGRIGYLATPRLLLYGTGGVAFGNVKSALNLSILGDPSFEIATSKTQAGWTAGAGAEFALTPNLTFKTEYLYVDLGAQTLLAGDDVSFDVETQFHAAKAGLNWVW